MCNNYVGRRIFYPLVLTKFHPIDIEANCEFYTSFLQYLAQVFWKQ
jgi:hypothetical protein